MAQPNEQELNDQQQPGAAPQDDKDKQLEEMKRMLAEKNAQLEDMKKKFDLLQSQNTTTGGTADGGNDENDSKMPPKTDVTLSLRGIPEYDQYPYSMQAEKFYFMASVKAPYFRSEERAPIDLVAVVDESGSMSGDRIKLVKETVQFIIKNLEKGDRFGIVGYSSGSRIVLPLTKMDEDGKKSAERLANGLRASGGTALCAGLVMGVNMMRERKIRNDVASVMILTDGQANEGPTSAAEINAAVKSGKVSGSSSYGIPPQFRQNRTRKKKRIQNKMNLLAQGMQQQQREDIYVGNLHEVDGKNHVWTMFVSTNNDKMVKPKTIKEVQYGLHRTFNPSEITLKDAPFYLKRKGWGTFEVSVKIIFNKSANRADIECVHMLDFDHFVTIKNIQNKTVSHCKELGLFNKPQEETQDDDEKKLNDEESTEGLMELNESLLPCTINTFGFGSGHNESLLESIAESGRGMYAFIESTDMIADTFAECLGGLVSIIGQNLKIKVEALNDVQITKCLSTGYQLKIDKARKAQTVSINNLQSEENRDLIFELKIPQIAMKKENDPIIQLSVNYKNVVKDKEETLSIVSTINRIEGKQIGERNIELDVQYNRVLAAEAMEETLSIVSTINRIEGKQIGERNIELDVQYNRVLAAEAMEEADDLANKGKLDDARKVLNNAQEHIKKSRSNKSKFSKALVNDIQTVQDNMRSKQQYRSHGGKMLKMNKKAHKMQRSVQSSAYASQSQYQNRSKSAMKRKFKK